MFSKQAVCAYVASQAFPLRKKGIRINAICPGPTDTPLARANAETWLGFGSDYRAKAGIDPAAPIEQAYPLLFLCSDAAAAISGITLTADSGYFSSGMSGSFPAATPLSASSWADEATAPRTQNCHAPGGGRRISERRTHMPCRDLRAGRPTLERLVVRLGRLGALAQFGGEEPAVDRSRAQPPGCSPDRRRPRVQRTAGSGDPRPVRRCRRCAPLRGPDPELAAPEKLFARKCTGRDEMHFDGRHAWLRLTPQKITSWDFRKM